MYTYNKLSKIPFVSKKYLSKFLLIAFLGIHVPFIGLIIYILPNIQYSTSLVRILLLVLALTLLSTIITLYVLDKLLTPLVIAKKSLDNYLTSGEIPNLPVHYKDEVGLLLKNVQVTIEKMNYMMTEKNNMIDLLSHDLRSPLSRIIALTTLIEMDKGNDPAEYTAHIAEEAKSLLVLLEDVLKMLKKADNNEVVFQLTPTSLKSFITQTVHFFQFTASEKNIHYHINIEDNLIVNIEPIMFAQAIKNLLGNALKFSEAGKNIYITSIAESKNLVLNIKDEGVGFDPKNKDKIFERFTNANKKGVNGEHSTGLGLSLAKMIIEKHGGQLLANSEGTGKGATFTIILPRTNPFTHAKGFKFIKLENPFKKAI